MVRISFVPLFIFWALAPPSHPSSQPVLLSAFPKVDLIHEISRRNCCTWLVASHRAWGPWGYEASPDPYPSTCLLKAESPLAISYTLSRTQVTDVSEPALISLGTSAHASWHALWKGTVIMDLMLCLRKWQSQSNWYSQFGHTTRNSHR